VKGSALDHSVAWLHWKLKWEYHRKPALSSK
jgi:hypothetical protein